MCTPGVPSVTADGALPVVLVGDTVPNRVNRFRDRTPRAAEEHLLLTLPFKPTLRLTYHMVHV